MPSKLEQPILAHLATFATHTNMKAIAKGVDASPEAIRHVVRRLVKAGLIDRIGGVRGTNVRYALKSKEDQHADLS